MSESGLESLRKAPREKEPKLTVLCAELRGSTNLAERVDPEQLVGFVNDYLGRMTEIILARQGTLDEYPGDELMALFDGSFPQEDHALRAVKVGLEMLYIHQRVMREWQARGSETTPIKVGNATGERTVEEIGYSLHTDRTVIGTAANLGSRNCGIANPNELPISQRTHDPVRNLISATPLPRQSFKGAGTDDVVYQVTETID